MPHLSAHEMTPTYPKFEMSYMPDVAVAELKLFNKRKEVEWYEISVTDAEWNNIPFVSVHKIIKLRYLEQVNVDVYVRSRDLNKVVYICSTSKLRREEVGGTAISTKVCSKVK